MRKADIANEIYEKVGVSKKEASDIVEFILNLLKAVLQKGESVKIAGFGNFVVRSKGARKGRNPRTGEEIGVNTFCILSRFFRSFGEELREEEHDEKILHESNSKGFRSMCPLLQI